jgi:hypothetical protein
MQLRRRGSDRFRDVVDQGATGRVRVLIGIQSYRDIELWCAIGGLTAQVFPQWQIGEGDS